VLDNVVLDFKDTSALALPPIPQGHPLSRLCSLLLPENVSSGDGSALLTYDFGDPDLKLVIWVKVCPDQNAAGVRVDMLPFEMPDLTLTERSLLAWLFQCAQGD